MNLRPITDVTELKKIQLEILQYVAHFCEENNISYWLYSGTLLGAVRHKGFIPWDDDIDIGMTRPNYDKFIKAFYDKTGRYSFHCVENDKKYCYQMGKVFDNNTVLYEPNKRYGYKIAVYIDVFVYDFIPEDPNVVKKLYRKRDVYTHIRTLQKAQEHKGSQLRQFCVHTIGKLLSVIPSRYITYKIVVNGKKYRYDESPFYGNLIGSVCLTIKRELLDSTIKMEFEGDLYNVPIGYEEFLTKLYGDYMQLPPEEKRFSQHAFEAYYIN